MNIYHLYPVLDNPLFEGLAVWNSNHFDTFPRDWRKRIYTWEATRLKADWRMPESEGRVRKFNDYPTINLIYPAFSQRAVDVLCDMLEQTGELLPVRHETGTYYLFNCTRVLNLIDIEKSAAKPGDVLSIGLDNGLVFHEEKMSDFLFFRDRTLPTNYFCTQGFVDRVRSAGLEGFVFIPVWPLPPGVTYGDEYVRLLKEAEKWKPNATTSLEIKGNTVVLRLRHAKKKPSKLEIAASEEVMKAIEKQLYDPDAGAAENYFGSIEGSDTVDYETRVFISNPDNNRLLAQLMPTLRTLPWPGKFFVVKRRGEYMDGQAEEEYIQIG